MPFRRLKPSSALEFEEYDVDNFLQTEKYAGASSIPLSPNTPAILRARLKLPSVSLSLVKTFPRIIHGYRLIKAAAAVVPMDQVDSARINGHAIGHSVLMLKGHFDCLVLEPESRLVAILHFRPPEKEPWLNLGDGYHLLDPSPDVLASLRQSITTALDTAANVSGFPLDVTARASMQQSLLTAIEAAARFDGNPKPVQLATDHWRIVARAEQLIRSHPTESLKSTELAQHLGVSVRTLQNATHSICGVSPRRYNQILRLWAARQQLRMGSAGVSVKACAVAHGFQHLGEFAASYRATFGELPSTTLSRSIRGITNPGN
jgi:AraC family ethanolamine operon transcriptional activator